MQPIELVPSSRKQSRTITTTTRRIGTHYRVRDAESLPLISISITQYSPRQTFNDPNFESRFVMSSQVGRVWLTIRTSYIPGKVLPKRLDAPHRVVA
jgi:hypothetical protein